eukprot:403373129
MNHNEYIQTIIGPHAQISFTKRCNSNNNQLTSRMQEQNLNGNDSEEFLERLYKQLFGKMKKKKIKRKNQDRSTSLKASVIEKEQDQEFEGKLIFAQSKQKSSKKHQRNLPNLQSEHQKVLDEVQEYAVDESLEQSQMVLQNAEEYLAQNKARKFKIKSEQKDKSKSKTRKKLDSKQTVDKVKELPNSQEGKNLDRYKKILDEKQLQYLIENPSKLDKIITDKFSHKNKAKVSRQLTLEDQSTNQQVNTTFDSYHDKDSSSLSRDQFHSTAQSFFSKRQQNQSRQQQASTNQNQKQQNLREYQSERPQTIIQNRYPKYSTSNYNQGELEQITQGIGYSKNRLILDAKRTKTAERPRNIVLDQNTQDFIKEMRDRQFSKNDSIRLQTSGMTRNAYNDEQQSSGMNIEHQTQDQVKSRNQAFDWSHKVRSLIRTSPKKNCPGCTPGLNQDFQKTFEHNHSTQRRDYRPLTNLKQRPFILNANFKSKSFMEENSIQVTQREHQHNTTFQDPKRHTLNNFQQKYHNNSTLVDANESSIVARNVDRPLDMQKILQLAQPRPLQEPPAHVPLFGNQKQPKFLKKKFKQLEQNQDMVEIQSKQIQNDLQENQNLSHNKNNSLQILNQPETKKSKKSYKVNQFVYESRQQSERNSILLNRESKNSSKFVDKHQISINKSLSRKSRDELDQRSIFMQNSDLKQIERQFRSVENKPRSRGSSKSSQVSFRSASRFGGNKNSGGKFVKKLSTGKIMVGSRPMSLEDFNRMRDSQSGSFSFLNSQTTKARADMHIMEDYRKSDLQNSIDKKSQLQLKIQHNLIDMSLQTYKSSNKNDLKQVDWKDSQLYQIMMNSQDADSVDQSQDQLLSKLIELQIDSEDMEEKRTLFYHYKKSKKIYSQIECEYNANILKKKLHRKDYIDEEHLYDIYFIALKTLGALMTLLMLKNQWRKIEALYGTDESHISVENCIKVLVRAKKMYEARSIMIMIIKFAVERENLRDQLDLAQKDEGINSKDTIPQLQRQLQKITSRIMSEIQSLQEDHKIFKRPFIMNGMDYLEHLKREYNELSNQFQSSYYLEIKIGEDESEELVKALNQSQDNNCKSLLKKQ